MCLSQCLNSVPLHGQGNGKEHNVFVHQLLLSFLSKHQLLYIVKGVVYCLTNRDYTLHHRLYMVKSRCVLEAEILNWIFFFSRLISKRNTCMQKFCIKTDVFGPNSQSPFFSCWSYWVHTEKERERPKSGWDQIMFLEQQISTLELFLTAHVTLKTGVMIQLWHHKNKLHIKIFKKRTVSLK